MKKVVTIVLFLIFTATLMKGYYFFTSGFRLNKLVYFSKDEVFEEKKPLDPKITDQRYFYLGKGRQSYVFASEDGKYVIKLIRYHKYQRPLWADIFAKLHLNFEKQKTMLFQQEERKQRAFTSYLLAKNELNFLSHVEFLHLKKTDYLKKNLLLFDAMGKKHILSLDDVYFIIQRKAESLQEKMLKLYEEKKEKKVKKLISSYIDMLLKRLNKNIANRDHMNYLRNSGVIKESVMEVDIGSFYLHDLQKKSSKEKELNLCLVTLEKFIDEKMPKLRLFLEEKKTAVIASL